MQSNSPLRCICINTEKGSQAPACGLLEKHPMTTFSSAIRRLSPAQRPLHEPLSLLTQKTGYSPFKGNQQSHQQTELVCVCQSASRLVSDLYGPPTKIPMSPAQLLTSGTEMKSTQICSEETVRFHAAPGFRNETCSRQ